MKKVKRRGYNNAVALREYILARIESGRLKV
jgi:hypothetical protein